MILPAAPRLSPTMSSRKLQALGFIETYFHAHGTGPSIGEIAAALHCSPPRALEAVRKLAREGRIHRQCGVPRGIRPLSADEEAVRRAQLAGFIVTKPALPGMFILGDDAGDGEEEEPQESSAPEHGAAEDRAGARAGSATPIHPR
jgi:SOS-response transcriptional repressor LexA